MKTDLLTTTSKISLSIIIVNWNSWSYLEKCLLSIREFGHGVKYEIIVVDNCSSDNSVEKITALFPEVILLKNKTNSGFPAANNQAFAVARGDFFLMLNPDTEVKSNTLQRSLDTLRNNPSIGCLGVKTRKGNGEILLSCARSRPTLWSTFCHLFYLDTIFKKNKFHKSIDMGYWDHNDSRDVELLHGGYMMFPKSLYRKIGGLDEKIPMFYEDLEFCCRIKSVGKRIYYLADVEIVHFVGVSCSQSRPAWITNLYCEADYLYFLEYGGGRQTAFWYVLMILLCFPVRILYSPVIWLGYLIVNHKKKRMSLIQLQIITSAKWAIKKIRCRKDADEQSDTGVAGC